MDGHNDNRLAPIGAVGKFVVEGPTVASSYIKNKTKADKTFIYNPSWLQHARPFSQTRIYKTGDFTQYDVDGSILFHGRRDTQVKIHGQGAKLTDIAHHLSAHPAVSRSVDVFLKSGAYVDTVVAVLKLKASPPSARCNGLIRLPENLNTTEPQFGLDQLKHHLESRLPLYMVPSVFLIVNDIPLDFSAKSDRKAAETWLASLPRSERQTLSSQVQHQEQGEPGLQGSLQGCDFHLTRVGIDSTLAISLSMYLSRQYGVKVGIEKLINNNTTIRLLARCIHQGGSQEDALVPLSADGLLREDAALSSQIRSGTANGIHPILSRTNPRNVLVTGGSGYLGTQILRRFFEDNDSFQVIAHVRAQTIGQGTRKIIAAAEKSKWWSAAYIPRLEIGDLSQRWVGLNTHQWARLCGLADEADNINIVAHNGAGVHWSHDYESLRSTNVGSTVELLKATIRSPPLCRLVYISGGQKMSVNDGDDREMAAQAAASSGYSQTKFVSEMIIREIDQSSRSNGRFFL